MEQTVELESQALALVDEAQGLVIADSESFHLADEYLTRNKQAQKAWLDFTQPTVDAANAAADAARGVRDRILKPLKEWEATIKGKMAAWNREQERIRIEAEAKANEEAKLAAAVAAEEAGEVAQAQAILDGYVDVAPVILPPSKPVTVKAQFREKWVFRVTNPNAIPREYLTPDLVKLGQVVRAMKGGTRIPGIEVYDEGTVASGRVAR